VVTYSVFMVTVTTVCVALSVWYTVNMRHVIHTGCEAATRSV